jgi:hypothetical protein
MDETMVFSQKNMGNGHASAAAEGRVDDEIATARANSRHHHHHHHHPVDMLEQCIVSALQDKVFAFVKKDISQTRYVCTYVRTYVFGWNRHKCEL